MLRLTRRCFVENSGLHQTERLMEVHLSSAFFCAIASDFMLWPMPGRTLHGKRCVGI
ncbi:hypothetical protein BRPE64_ECDS03250 (plasmid) [Caballeronia insecticola]|uniref:Uncharacterized protein n=1 Tax=Caballeronia insecticola TaxID=758793 RepID=A0A060PHG3_9BURK|nr:hypothetical protein BRPE64_ECDS03250 [Caballeronia insecticola]